MEQRGIRVLETNTTFFSKITTSITKLLIPTKVGINSMLIGIKRNMLIKAYEGYKNVNEEADNEKKGAITKKYEEAYTLYLEAIDKYIMDSVYTKVKNNNASEFERNALSKYYEVTHLKESEYLEYKHRKQKYLLELDYENIKENVKTRHKFLPFYIEKMDNLYKGILKNYSIQLSDNVHSNERYRNNLYNKIFGTLEDYITNILPIKLEVEGESKYQVILKEYEEYENFTVGKLDEKEQIERNMILLGISRQLFTHSLPLIAAEQCYVYLLKETRKLIVNAKTKEKQEESYKMLITLIEDYNIKLLSTKIYWDKPTDKEEYKKFWNEYKAINEEQKKEILFIKNDIKKLRKSKKDYKEIINFYHNKLLEYGEMKNLKDSYKILTGRFVKYGNSIRT